LRSARVRFRKVLINDHDIARTVAMRKFPDKKISARDRGYKAVGRRPLAMSRDIADMINLVGLKLQQRWTELLDLQVDVLKIVPRWRFVSKLINSSASIVAYRRREISKIGQAASAVGKGRIGFKAKVCRRRLTVIEMGNGQDDVPEFDPVPLASSVDGLQVGPIVAAKRAVIHERVVIVADDLRMADTDESLDVIGVIRGSKL